jgi:hypothetical protein
MLENFFYKCAYAFSHGVDKDHLGLVPLYYSLAYSNKAQKCVVVGSGGGVVPMALRQAQRDLGDESAETWLIDGFVKEAGYGHPEETGGWGHPHSVLRTRFPDIQLLRKNSRDCGGLIKDIDFLHIDAEHTYSAVLADFNTFSADLSPKAVITFHDTMDEGVQSAVSEIAERFSYEILNLRDMASGLSVLRKSTKSGYRHNIYDDCKSRPRDHQWVMRPVDLDSIEDLKEKD